MTTTGNVNVCDENMLKALKKRAVVCNIGHFDNEIDTAFMRKNFAWEEIKPQVHKIHRTGPGAFDAQNDDYLILLAEGRLVNLGNATGHPSRNLLLRIDHIARHFVDELFQRSGIRPSPESRASLSLS